METPAYDDEDEVKTTMTHEEARNLRCRVIELHLQQKSENDNRNNYDAILIYEAVCLDPEYSQIATIGRVKQICKEIKAEEAKKIKAADEEKRISEQFMIKSPDSLPLWPKGKSVRDVLDKGKTSIFSVAEKWRAGLGSTNTMGKDPYFDFRESLLAIASNYDIGDRWHVLLDAEQSSGIGIVVHHIRTQTDGLPLFYFEWSHHLKSDPNYIPMLQMLHEKGKKLIQVISSLEEQKLWLAELKRFIRKDCHCVHKSMQRSYILCPQPAVDLYPKVNLDSNDIKNPSSKDSRVCGHCHGRGSFNCSGCNGIHYCSKECQKLDWKLHKIVCNTKPIGDKESVVIPVQASLGIGSDKYFCELSATGLGATLHGPTDIAINPYGSARFIIKCQISLGPLHVSRQQPILIYDKGKLLHRSLDPLEQNPHSVIHNIAYTKGHKNCKMYLHAKREGSNLRIYTSDIPDQSIYIGDW
jgi:hypothetical protein